mmetsp:Transcript_10077/g.61253  ORF Transcript_10077/g.61253 Transcript_10077/m.61253 type:complete len:236 (-) Transcript_10077:28-735(-)
MLRHYLNIVGHQIDRIKSNAELSDQVHVPTFLHLFQEGRGPRFGNGAQVIDEVFLGHTNAGVSDRQHVLFLVQRDFDFELGLIPFSQHPRIGQGKEPDFVQCIGCIGDEFSQEDILLAVEGMDDDVHEPRHFGLEGELLPFLHLFFVVHLRRLVGGIGCCFDAFFHSDRFCFLCSHRSDRTMRTREQGDQRAHRDDHPPFSRTRHGGLWTIDGCSTGVESETAVGIGSRFPFGTF